MIFRDHDFTDQRVLLDGSTFTGCTFRRCELVVTATAPIEIRACRFKEEITFVLDGPAAAFIELLKAIVHDSNEGGSDFVHGALKQLLR